MVPWYLHGDGHVLLLTILGLGITVWLLRQSIWRFEKFDATRNTDKGIWYALMRENEPRHFFIIRNMHEHALDLGSIAASSRHIFSTGEVNVICDVASCWWIFTIGCVLSKHPEYLFSIMAIGFASTMIMAALPCTPAFLGIPLVECHSQFGFSADVLDYLEENWVDCREGPVDVLPEDIEEEHAAYSDFNIAELFQ